MNFIYTNGIHFSITDVRVTFPESYFCNWVYYIDKNGLLLITVNPWTMEKNLDGNWPFYLFISIHTFLSLSCLWIRLNLHVFIFHRCFIYILLTIRQNGLFTMFFSFSSSLARSLEESCSFFIHASTLTWWCIYFVASN